MNYFYTNGTPVINGFKVTSEVPLDPRLTVENIAERDSLVTNHIAYDRMYVYVKSNDTKYIYHKDTGEWEIDNKFSEDDKVKLDNIEEYLTKTEHLHNTDNELIYREHSYSPSTDDTILRDHLIQEARVGENGELYNGLLSKFYVNRLNNVTGYLTDTSFTKSSTDNNLYLTKHSYNPDKDTLTKTNVTIPVATDDNNGLLSNIQNIKINRIKDFVNKIDTTHANVVSVGLTYNYNIYNPNTNLDTSKTITIPLATDVINGLQSNIEHIKLGRVLDYMTSFGSHVNDNLGLKYIYKKFNPNTNTETEHEVIIPLSTHVLNGLLKASDKVKLDDIESYIKSISLRQASNTEELGIDYITTNPNTQIDTPGYFNIPLVTDSRNGLVSPARKHWMDNANGVSNTGTTSDTWQLKKSDIDTKIDPAGGVVLKSSGGNLEVRTKDDADHANLTVKDLTIKGDVTQEGKSFITEAEKVEVADNTILLNRGEVGAGVTKGFAGLEIDRGTLPKFQILFNESDRRFKAGEEGDLWCLALRDNDSDMNNGMFVSWDSSTKRLKTTNIVPSDRKLYFTDTTRHLGIGTYSWGLTYTSPFGNVTIGNPTGNEYTYLLTNSSIGFYFNNRIKVVNGIYGVNTGLAAADLLLYRGSALKLTLGDTKSTFTTPVTATTFNRSSDNSEVLYHADIINNLTSGGADKVLSAEQGKILKGITDDIKTDISSNYLPLTAGKDKPLTGLLYTKKGIILPNGEGIYGEDVAGTGIAGKILAYGGGTSKYDISIGVPFSSAETVITLVADTVIGSGNKNNSTNLGTTANRFNYVYANTGDFWSKVTSGTVESTGNVVAGNSIYMKNGAMVFGDDAVTDNVLVRQGEFLWNKYNNASGGFIVGKLLVSNDVSTTEINKVPTNGIYVKGKISSGLGLGVQVNRTTNITFTKSEDSGMTEHFASFPNNTTDAPGVDPNGGGQVNDGFTKTYFWSSDFAAQFALDIDGTGVAYRGYTPSKGVNKTGWKFLADTGYISSKYLPLAAGSGKPLTGILYANYGINIPEDVGVRFYNGSTHRSGLHSLNETLYVGANWENINIGSSNVSAVNLVGTPIFFKGQKTIGGSAIRIYNNVFQGLLPADKVGILKIQLPNSWESRTMLLFEIDIYQSVVNSNTKYIVSGYIYTPSSSWIYAGASVAGTYLGPVKLAHDGEKCCILIGTPTTTWTYNLTVSITKITASYSAVDSWGSGYSMEVIPNETGITIAAIPTINATGLISKGKNVVNTNNATDTIYERTLGINGTMWGFTSFSNSNSTTIYAPTTAGTSGQILQSSGGVPTWIDKSTITANYLPLTGGTMTGGIKLSPAGGDLTECGIYDSTGGLLLGYDTTYSYVGNLTRSTVIRSNASNLMHDYNGTLYTIWNSRNLSSSVIPKRGTFRPSKQGWVRLAKPASLAYGYGIIMINNTYSIGAPNGITLAYQTSYTDSGISSVTQLAGSNTWFTKVRSVNGGNLSDPKGVAYIDVYYSHTKFNNTLYVTLYGGYNSSLTLQEVDEEVPEGFVVKEFGLGKEGMAATNFTGNLIGLADTVKSYQSTETTSRYLTGVSGSNSGHYYSSKVYITPSTGKLTTDTLTITNTNAVSHLEFSRNSYNYISCNGGSSSLFAFVTANKANSVSNSDLIISNNSVHPGTTNVVNLGTPNNRWKIVNATKLSGALEFESLTDLNNATMGRIFTSNTNFANTPTNTWSSGITLGPNNDTQHKHQIAFGGLGTNIALYIRSQSSNTWGTWRQVLTKDVSDSTYLPLTAGPNFKLTSSLYLNNNGNNVSTITYDLTSNTDGWARGLIHYHTGKSISSIGACGSGNKLEYIYLSPTGTYSSSEALKVYPTGNVDIGGTFYPAAGINIGNNVGLRFLDTTTSTYVSGLHSYSGELRLGYTWPKIYIGNTDATVNIDGDTYFHKGRSFIGNNTRVHTDVYSGYISPGLNGVGTIKIQLPNTWSNTMLYFEIDIYDYRTNSNSKYIISGYNYISSLNSWENRGASLIGTNIGRVRLGHDGEKCCIFIGDTNSKLHYTQLSITKAIVHYSSRYYNWNTGYSVSVITDESTLTHLIEVPINGSGLTSKNRSVVDTDNASTQLYTRGITLNGGEYAFTSFVTGGSKLAFYAPTTTGTSGQILQSTGGTPTWVNKDSITGNYLPLSGGTITGNLTANNSIITVTRQSSTDAKGYICIGGGATNTTSGNLGFCFNYDNVPFSGMGTLYSSANLVIYSGVVPKHGANGWKYPRTATYSSTAIVVSEGAATLYYSPSGKKTAGADVTMSSSILATQTWVTQQGYLTSVPAQSWASITGKKIDGSGNEGPVDCNTIGTNGAYYYRSNGPSTSIGSTAIDGALFHQQYSETWKAQIAQDYRNGNLFVRGKNNGTWTAWKKVALIENIPTTIAWGNVTGKPTFATVATSGSYNDLTNKPTIPSAYTLPTATSSVLGGIKIGYTASGKTYPVLLNSSNQAYVSVPWTDTNTTYAQATASSLGLVKIGATGLSTKQYAIQLNASGQMFVAVPWTDTDTNTHYITRLYAGASGTAANAVATNPYIKVTDDNTYRNQLRLVGAGGTTIASDASGNITITSTNTTYAIASATVAGLVKPISIITKPTLQAVTTTSGRYYSIQMSSDGNMFANIPWTNYYLSGWTWANGTSSGPTASATRSGASALSIPAIPSATASISGVVTTGTQTFAGEKVFNSGTCVPNTVSYKCKSADGISRNILGMTSSNTTVLGFTSFGSRVLGNTVELYSVGDAESITLKHGTYSGSTFTETHKLVVPKENGYVAISQDKSIIFKVSTTPPETGTADNIITFVMDE